MLKLSFAVLAVALAGTASAGGWRSMRVEATDIDSFTKSVVAFEEELSTPRHYVFKLALRDLWRQGMQRASAEQREYTETEYFMQLDGLSYEEIVALADATGETTKARYRQAVKGSIAARGPGSTASSALMADRGTPVGGPGGQYRGGRGY